MWPSSRPPTHSRRRGRPGAPAYREMLRTVVLALARRPGKSPEEDACRKAEEPAPNRSEQDQKDKRDAAVAEDPSNLDAARVLCDEDHDRNKCDDEDRRPRIEPCATRIPACALAPTLLTARCHSQHLSRRASRGSRPPFSDAETEHHGGSMPSALRPLFSSTPGLASTVPASRTRTLVHVAAIERLRATTRRAQERTLSASASTHPRPRELRFRCARRCRFGCRRAAGSRLFRRRRGRLIPPAARSVRRHAETARPASTRSV